MYADRLDEARAIFEQAHADDRARGDDYNRGSRSLLFLRWLSCGPDDGDAQHCTRLRATTSWSRQALCRNRASVLYPMSSDRRTSRPHRGGACGRRRRRLPLAWRERQDFLDRKRGRAGLSRTLARQCCRRSQPPQGAAGAARRDRLRRAERHPGSAGRDRGADRPQRARGKPASCSRSSRRTRSGWTARGRSPRRSAAVGCSRRPGVSCRARSARSIALSQRTNGCSSRSSAHAHCSCSA